MEVYIVFEHQLMGISRALFEVGLRVAHPIVVPRSQTLAVISTRYVSKPKHDIQSVREEQSQISLTQPLKHPYDIAEVVVVDVDLYSGHGQQDGTIFLMDLVARQQ